MKNYEIERKFLVEPFSKKEKFLLELASSPLYITQVYFNGVRYRQVADFTKKETYRFYKTIKIGEGFVREEYENEIVDKYEIAEILKIISSTNPTIRKKRYLIHYHEKEFSIDFYDDIDLIIGEVELSNIDENIYIPPMFEKEITGIKEYSNEYLANGFCEY